MSWNAFAYNCPDILLFGTNIRKKIKFIFEFVQPLGGQGFERIEYGFQQFNTMKVRFLRPTKWGSGSMCCSGVGYIILCYPTPRFTLGPNYILPDESPLFSSPTFTIDYDHRVMSGESQITPDSKVHGANMGSTWGPPDGSRWAPCWTHEPCYLGRCYIKRASIRRVIVV